MQERKNFVCRSFRHITHYCKNMGEERSILMPLNRFEVLKYKVINIGEDSGREISKDRKTILREKILKREKSIEVQKIGVEKNSNNVEKNRQSIKRDNSENRIETGEE